MRTASPAAPALALLTDLAYTLTEERPSIHFVCSSDGSFVSAFTSKERALAEWEHLRTKHKGSYWLSQGTSCDATRR